MLVDIIYFSRGGRVMTDSIFHGTAPNLFLCTRSYFQPLGTMSRMWFKLPPFFLGVPVSSDVDYDALALDYELSGGLNCPPPPQKTTAMNTLAHTPARSHARTPTANMSTGIHAHSHTFIHTRLCPTQHKHTNNILLFFERESKNTQQESND